MAEEMLTLPKFEEASEIVKKVTQETKLVYSKYFSEQTGNKVYLKPENMQLTGAYKLRGACKRTDHRICRKPCTGRCVCGKMLRCKGCHRNADYHTAHQSRAYPELRR